MVRPHLRPQASDDKHFRKSIGGGSTRLVLLTIVQASCSAIAQRPAADAASNWTHPLSTRRKVGDCRNQGARTPRRAVCILPAMQCMQCMLPTLSMLPCYVATMLKRPPACERLFRHLHAPRSMQTTVTASKARAVYGLTCKTALSRRAL